MYLFRYLLDLYGMFRWLLTLYLYIYDITYLILFGQNHHSIKKLCKKYFMFIIDRSMCPSIYGHEVQYSLFTIRNTCKFIHVNFVLFLSKYKKIYMYIIHFINNDMHVKIFCSWLRLVWSLVYLVAVRSSWMTRYI